LWAPQILRATGSGGLWALESVANFLWAWAIAGVRMGVVLAWAFFGLLKNLQHCAETN